MNTVLASLRPSARGPLVTTDDVYGAVRNAMRATCERPAPSWSRSPCRCRSLRTNRSSAAIDDALDGADPADRDRPRDVADGVVFPVGAIVARAGARASPSMVDSAHAPGMLPVDVAPSAPTSGRATCTSGSARRRAPPSCGWRRSTATGPSARDFARSRSGIPGGVRLDRDARPDAVPGRARRDRLHGLVRLGAGDEHDHALAAYGRDIVEDRSEPRALVDDERFGSMSLVELPDGVAPTFDAALALQERLFDEHRIEVPMTWWNDRAFVRHVRPGLQRARGVRVLAAALRLPRRRPVGYLRDRVPKAIARYDRKAAP